MQVVIAEQTEHGAVSCHAAAQYFGRIGAAVYQVAEDIQGVSADREIRNLQQLLKGVAAALNVADTVK